MIRIILIAFLSVPFLAAGQDTLAKPRLPEFTYVTPQMSKKQIDSLSTVLKLHGLFLSFDTVVYDSNKRIKEVSGTLEVDRTSEHFPLSSTNFKGITIISRGDSTTIIMGLLPPPPPKK
jgi:hypothetical protein